MKEIFSRIFSIEDKLATLNTVKHFDPFSDGLAEVDGKEFRFWNPTRSKMAAAIVRGIKDVPNLSNKKVLYLDIAHAYTASHLSDVIDRGGIIYGVEFSERPFNDTLQLCKKYENIVPMLNDARKPETYYWVERVDIVYCDIAQTDQTDIAIRNCKEFLKKNGFLLLAIKARSIDVTKPPNQIYREEIGKLQKDGFEVLDWKNLEPFEDAHAFIVARMQ